MGLKIRKINPHEKNAEIFMVGLSEYNPNYNEYGSGVMPNAQRYTLEDGFSMDFLDFLNDSRKHLEKKESEDLSYIIKKISSSLDYEKRLRSIINKIYESDHFDKIKNIKDITESYFSLKKKYIEEGKPENVAKMNAFQESTKFFVDQFSLFYKKAQYSENSPVYVAEELSSVIKIMLQRIKPESRLKSLNKIRDKIKDFNVPELAGKKSPGGAAIGVTISLVKNMLMARDQFFIDAVLRELMLRL